MPMASEAPPPTVDVIIVGAGLSGIAAGRTLHEAGTRDILILEADSKIGGRIRTAEIGGYTVEIGANWLTGGGGGAAKSSPLLEIATHQLNLEMHLSDFSSLSSNAYKQEGGLYSKQEVEEALTTAKARDEFCTRLSSNIISDDSSDISLLEAQRLAKQVPTTPLEMVIDYFENDYEDAEPPSVTSLKNTLPRHEFLDFGHKIYFVADSRGFHSIVHYIAKQFLSHHYTTSTSDDGNQLITFDDPRIKLNQVVREINYWENGVRVKTEDGCEYQAKFAIVSVSLGVLQSNLIKFNPNLPKWKRRAVNKFHMGDYTKIFLKFPYMFWPSNIESEFFIYAHEKRGYYPAWQNLENLMPGSSILLVTVTGDEAKRIDKLNDEAVQEEVMDVLRKMFGTGIPNSDEILVSRWLSNRFFGGSYSNWPVGYKQSDHKQLKNPVGPIFFTREHTNAKYSGYADGAYCAVETANELVKCVRDYKASNQTKDLETMPSPISLLEGKISQLP